MDGKIWNAFMIYDEAAGCLVFTLDDPANDGCNLEAKRVEVIVEPGFGEAEWKWGQELSNESVVGRDPVNRERYRIFKWKNDLLASSFEEQPGRPEFVARWSDYAVP